MVLSEKPNHGSRYVEDTTANERERSGSYGGDTMIEQDEVFAQGDHKVDMERAAQLNPTRLRGKALGVMITVVAGTGVCVIARVFSCESGIR